MLSGLNIALCVLATAPPEMFSSFSPSAEAHRLVIHHHLNLTVSPVKHTASSRPRNVVFLKLHKISGSTAAYDIYTALNQTRQPFHSMHKTEYTRAAYVANGCGSQGVTCAFLQHMNLGMYAARGSGLLGSLLGSRAGFGDATVTTTILRDPVSRTLSGYFYGHCGPVDDAETVKATLASATARACAYADEYERTFRTGGLPALTGIIEQREYWYPALASELQLPLASFETSLPLMVKSLSPAAEGVRQQLLASAPFREWLRKETPAEFEWYDAAVERWAAWKTRLGRELESDKDTLLGLQAAYRERVGLDVTKPFTCTRKGSAESAAPLPALDWEGSGLGQGGIGRGFAYCV